MSKTSNVKVETQGQAAVHAVTGDELADRNLERVTGGFGVLGGGVSNTLKTIGDALRAAARAG